MSLRYAVVTPARNEAGNLPRLRDCLAAQTAPPLRWVLVDTGSTDETPAVVRSFTREAAWIASAEVDVGRLERGKPVVEAFEAGLEAVSAEADVVVKLDADVSFPNDYFERLLAAFEQDETLGIASGSAFELEDGEWRQRFSSGDAVWGAARAYRRACLEAILPLERQMGWDGIDEIRAQMRGWRTATLLELPFRHHRREGERDGAQWRAWAARGRAAHYMGYRAWYLGLRALHHARRHPAALAMLWGYSGSVVRRRAVCPDPKVREHLRRSQRLRNLGMRRRQALGASR